MKLFCRLGALALTVALLLSLAACADFGVGEGEDDFKQYFSGVHVLSASGAKDYPIEDFNRDIHLGDDEIPTVVSYDESCYIGFRVSDGYTVTLSEFAFFARAATSGVLALEFYTVDKMPTSVKDKDGDGVTPPDPDAPIAASAQTEEETGTEADTEISEEEIFIPSKKFHGSTFSVDEDWSSVHLKFDAPQVVRGGEYVVVRIHNNCASPDGTEDATPSVSFTFNYLLFHFTDAHKK